MFRILLNAILILLAARFAVSIARLMTGRKQAGPRLDEEPQSKERRARPRVDRSDAVDVPFTEIPPDSHKEAEKKGRGEGAAGPSAGGF